MLTCSSFILIIRAQIEASMSTTESTSSTTANNESQTRSNTSYLGDMTLYIPNQEFFINIQDAGEPYIDPRTGGRYPRKPTKTHYDKNRKLIKV